MRKYKLGSTKKVSGVHASLSIHRNRLHLNFLITVGTASVRERAEEVEEEYSYSMML